jgi:hypothetical protein
MSTNSEAKKAEIEKINKYTQDLYKENCNNANQLKKKFTGTTDTIVQSNHKIEQPIRNNKLKLQYIENTKEKPERPHKTLMSPKNSLHHGLQVAEDLNDKSHIKKIDRIYKNQQSTNTNENYKHLRTYHNKDSLSNNLTVSNKDNVDNNVKIGRKTYANKDHKEAFTYVENNNNKNEYDFYKNYNKNDPRYPQTKDRIFSEGNEKKVVNKNDYNSPKEAIKLNRNYKDNISGIIKSNEIHKEIKGIANKPNSGNFNVLKEEAHKNMYEKYYFDMNSDHF